MSRVSQNQEMSIEWETTSLQKSQEMEKRKHFRNVGAGELDIGTTEEQAYWMKYRTWFYNNNKTKKKKKKKKKKMTFRSARIHSFRVI